MQFGFIGFIHYVGGIILSFTTEYMMNSWGADGMFAVFSAANFAGYFFFTHSMKETYGLNDRQKKMLYQPTELIDEDEYIAVDDQKE